MPSHSAQTASAAAAGQARTHWAALQSQEQPVIALSRRIDGLLIDQQCINDTAHLDELLPIVAVACKARYLSRGHRTDFAKANFGDHAFEAGAGGSARCRAAKVFINDLDLRPAQQTCRWGRCDALHGSRKMEAATYSLVRSSKAWKKISVPISL